MKHVVALSGGKDSTALALRLAEVEPREYIYLCTPTGDEMPELVEHWTWLEGQLRAPIQRVSNRTLDGWIDEFDALPNWRQRWCTRLLKIEPCRAFLAKLGDVTLHVGLRADEPEREGVMYGGAVVERYPLREWGWGVEQVIAYCRERGARIPRRTDCARCYGQRLGEWFELWRDHRDIYADAEAQELRIGKTFRSPGRDTWPAGLAELRAEFEGGRVPRGVRLPVVADADDEEDDAAQSCRVCRL